MLQFLFDLVAYDGLLPHIQFCKRKVVRTLRIFVPHLNSEFVQQQSRVVFAEIRTINKIRFSIFVSESFFSISPIDILLWLNYRAM